ncbi:MAG: hypothetical protein Q9160_005060 [Pyrenula sp. 1 TL-2023]
MASGYVPTTPRLSALEGDTSHDNQTWSSSTTNTTIPTSQLAPAHWREEQEMLETARQLSLADHNSQQYRSHYDQMDRTVWNTSNWDPPVSSKSTSQHDRPSTPTATSDTPQNGPNPSSPHVASVDSSWSWAEVMQLQFAAEMSKILHPEGDTAVYIDPPPKKRDQGDLSYQRTVNHFQAPHVIPSIYLRELGSRKLEAMFAPTAQFRMKRRLGNAGYNVTQSPKIKYYLDWRVPVDGDEALVLLEGLTCTSGVLAWAKAQQHYKINKRFVQGQDDPALFEGWAKWQKMLYQETISQQAKVTPIKDQKSKKENKADKATESEDTEKKPSEKILNWDGELPRPPPVVEESHDTDDTSNVKQEDQSRKPAAVSAPLALVEPPQQEEYCPLRHRSAMERLLHAACGQDPCLDSAPKMWTYFAIAKYFECVENSKICSWITVWLSDPLNSNFIQANPEVTYRISIDIKSEYLVKTSFSILAAERALAIANEPNAPTNARPASVHRIKVENLDDDEKNRVDHAANNFFHRVTHFSVGLCDENMHWLETCPEFKKLLENEYRDSRQVDARDELVETLKIYVRCRINSILNRNFTTSMRDLETDIESVFGFYPLRNSFAAMYNVLPINARLLTRTFWRALQNEQWSPDHLTNYHSPDAEGQPVLARGESTEKIAVLHSELRATVDNYNVRVQVLNVPRPAVYPRPPELEPKSELKMEDEEVFDADWWNSDTRTTHVAPHLDPLSPPILETSTFNDFPFFQHVQKYLHNLCSQLINPPHLFQDGSRLPITLVDTLLCLDEDHEFKYLPLWAGGLDDGETGGVFEEADVPLLEAESGGFKGGAGIHTVGSAANSAASTDDSFSDVASTAAGTVVVASHRATEGAVTGASSDYDMVSESEGFGNMDDVWEEVERIGVARGEERQRKMMEDETDAGTEVGIESLDEDDNMKDDNANDEIDDDEEFADIEFE